jgi:hypothetical protein
MTLDEAIIHAECVAESGCDECSQEHAQLAEWLRELKNIHYSIKEMKPNSVMVMRFPIDEKSIDLDTALQFFNAAKALLPKHGAGIMIPKSFDFDYIDKDLMIKELEEVIKYLKAEDE